MFKDGRYPPKNRSGKVLGPIEICIEDADGIKTYDPNSLIMTHVERGLPLGGTVGASVISGEPGYRYMEDDVVLILTKDELVRLVEHDLKPEEFKKLRDLYGVFFSIHDDFFDMETGEALQSLAMRQAVLADDEEGAECTPPKSTKP